MKVEEEGHENVPPGRRMLEIRTASATEDWFPPLPNPSLPLEAMLIAAHVSFDGLI